MAKTTMTIMRPGQPTESRDVELLDRPNFDELDRLIKPLLNGGHVEHVYVLWQDKRADMFVDEDGHAKMLPRNEEATAIYRAATMSGRTATP